jgi:hypothetical protein
MLNKIKTKCEARVLYAAIICMYYESVVKAFFTGKVFAISFDDYFAEMVDYLSSKHVRK